MDEAVNDAYSTLREAERCFHEAIRDAYPVGWYIEWKHGERWRTAEVLDHHRDTIRVRGQTGREYWLNWNRTVALCP